jgi:hypothetical protein
MNKSNGPKFRFAKTINQFAAVVALVAFALAGLVRAQPSDPNSSELSDGRTAATSVRYQVEYIPRAASRPESPLVAQGINENGDVTGWVTGSPGRAWVFTDGAGTTLLPNLPGKANGFAWEINDLGQVAGSSGFESIEPPERATRWNDGVPQDLGTLGTDSRAYSVNNLGHVAGSSTVSNSHGFFWSDATGIVDIAPNLGFTTAYDLNDADQVTGRAGNGFAFRWQNGVRTDLPPPAPWRYSAGLAINENGQIAGSVTNSTGNAQNFARYSNGVGWEVLGGFGQHNELWGINDRGDAVGQGLSPQFDVGFVYLEGAGLFQLNDLQENPGQWFIIDARDINNTGQIAAYARAQDGTGREGAVRLTPSSPIPQSAFSRKTHGAAGTFDVPLPLSGNVGVEGRSGGATNDYQMIVNFANTVMVESVAVTSGTGSVGGFSLSGSQVTVNLTSVTNVQRITVTLHNVNDGTSTGDVPVSMGVLVGDVNGNAVVNSSDIALTKAQAGQPVTMSNFREDVNASGTISSTDVAIVKSDVGTALP